MILHVTFATTPSRSFNATSPAATTVSVPSGGSILLRVVVRFVAMGRSFCLEILLCCCGSGWRRRKMGGACRWPAAHGRCFTDRAGWIPTLMSTLRSVVIGSAMVFEIAGRFNTIRQRRRRRFCFFPALLQCIVCDDRGCTTTGFYLYFARVRSRMVFDILHIRVMCPCIVVLYLFLFASI